MSYRESTSQLAEYRREIAAIREKMRAVQGSVEPEEVRDYRLQTAGGEVLLSALFGDKDTLFVIHNMGAGCASCTMWADGFNGVYPHLRERAAFVLTSPDPPERQRNLAAERGWRFPMVSHQGTTFAADMGYSRDGRPLPGASVLRRDGGRIVRVADTGFSPGDDFCTVWHFLDLLPEGAAGWRPKHAYAS